MSYRAIPGRLITTALLAVPAGVSLSGEGVAPGRKTISEWIVQLRGAPTPEARVEAAQSLCDPMDDSKDPSAMEPLIGALRDGNARVRYASVDALGCLGDQRAVSPLITTTLRDRNPGVRELAANIVGHGFSTNRQSVVALIAALKDRNASVRSMAAGGLYNIKDVQALDALVEGLRDPDPEVRGDVASALGHLQDPRAGDPLLKALNDADPRARVGAMRGLGDLGDRRAVGPLRAALKDPDVRVRKGAAGALGELKDTGSAADLRALAGDKDPWVRYQASFALFLMDLGELPTVPPIGRPLPEPRIPQLPPDDGGP